MGRTNKIPDFSKVSRINNLTWLSEFFGEGDVILADFIAEGFKLNADGYILSEG